MDTWGAQMPPPKSALASRIMAKAKWGCPAPLLLQLHHSAERKARFMEPEKRVSKEHDSYLAVKAFAQEESVLGPCLWFQDCSSISN